MAMSEQRLITVIKDKAELFKVVNASAKLRHKSVTFILQGLLDEAQSNGSQHFLRSAEKLSRIKIVVRQLKYAAAEEKSVFKIRKKIETLEAILSIGPSISIPWRDAIDNIIARSKAIADNL